MRLRIENMRKVNSEKIAEFAVVMYFAYPFFRTLCGWIFRGNSLLATTVALLAVYLPVFLLYVAKPRKYLKPDVILLYLWLGFFLYCSATIHPEYQYYYDRPDYGVWDHILIPYRGIYAYLFVRMLDDPDKILNCIRRAGVLMLFQFGYQIMLYYRRGYWYGVTGLVEAEMSYSVSFGYEVLPFALVFLYMALKEKKALDITASLLCIFMILAGGSRGPVLFIGLFFVLYVSIQLKHSRKKALILLAIILGTIVLYFTYDAILLGLSALISKMGLSSRFITKLLSGEISNDSGRSRIWAAAASMIKKPFGYGALGSRPVICDIIMVGYPHSIIYEILIDYGVIVGTVILLVLLQKSLSILFFKNSGEWTGVFMIFFCSASSLFISLTYWSVPTFWACLGIGVNCLIDTKKKRRKNLKGPQTAE